MRRRTLALALTAPFAAALAGTLGLGGCERNVCLDGVNCPPAPPPPPSPDRGPVSVTVDTTQALGPIVTGGGTNFTGFAAYVDPGKTGLAALEQMPYSLNRIHFSGEVPDPATFTTEDRLNEHLPQPSAPPSPWNFQWLDPVVAVAKSIRDTAGIDFIFTIHNAPQWMTVDQTIQGTLPRNADDYATYCARLVAYYNLGSFVDDEGNTVTNPAGKVGVHYWEIWNEPDINDVGEGDNPVMTPDQYASLFVTVTAAMRKVDPTIKIGGPNTISDIDDTPDYIDALLATGAQVDFIAIHQYQASSDMPDQEAFQVASVMQNRPQTNLPLVISESNSDSQDNQNRTGSAFEWAAMPLEYKSHVESGTWRVLRWETYERNYNLVDALSGATTTTYWAERVFWGGVPLGGTRVACSTTSDDVACLASLTPAGKVDVVLINIGVASPTDNNGTGVQHEIGVTVAGKSAAAFSVQVVDRDTDPMAGPAATTGDGSNVIVDGYGVATLEER
jgi:Glycosyl hydrolases family 39